MMTSVSPLSLVRARRYDAVVRVPEPPGRVHDATADNRPQVFAALRVRPDFYGLVVEHVDGSVAGRLDAPDVAEQEVGVVPFEAPELHAGQDGGGGHNEGEL